MTVAVVTGAGSGMGRACVDRLRAIVDVVVAVDLAAPDIDGTVPIACDISDPEAVASLATDVGTRGGFRALVHAAGISPTMGDARRVLAIDLVGTELLLRAFEPLVVPGSAAVCFASSAAHVLAPFVDDAMEALLVDPGAEDFLDRAVELTTDDSGFAYALAKLGVIRSAARAAVRWGPQGGRVVSLSPGIIDTPMGRQELEEQPIMQDLLAQTPLRRVGSANEVAAVAAFLVSDAASFVSGIDVLVDGGQVQGSKAAVAAAIGAGEG